jgi:hypothetical protein
VGWWDLKWSRRVREVDAVGGFALVPDRGAAPGQKGHVRRLAVAASCGFAIRGQLGPHLAVVLCGGWR